MLYPDLPLMQGNFIAAGSYLADNGAQAVASGAADLVAYGRWACEYRTSYGRVR